MSIIIYVFQTLSMLYIGWQWRNSSYHIYASCFLSCCRSSSAKCFLLGHHFLSKIALIRTFS